MNAKQLRVAVQQLPEAARRDISSLISELAACFAINDKKRALEILRLLSDAFASGEDD